MKHNIDIIKCNKNDIKINSYIVTKNNRAIVIDPYDFDEITQALGDKELDFILLTHEHFDHIMATDKLREKYQAKVIAQIYTSKNIQSSSKNLSKFSSIILDFMNIKPQEKIPEITINEADITFDKTHELIWQDIKITFTHTPGHSKGSSCIVLEDFLFAGDSLFEFCETDTKGLGCSTKEYKDTTLSFLNSLKNLKVYAGHYQDFLLHDKLKAKQKAIEIFKKRSAHTNCFVDFNQFKNLLESCDFIVRKDSIFLVKEEEKFCRFYYFLDDFKELKNLDEFLKSYKKDMVLEVISTKKVDNKLYKSAGFLPYKTFSRYHSKNVKYTSNKLVKRANAEDLEQIRTMLDKTFDIYSDYIPSAKELELLAINKEIYVVKKGKTVAGVAIYQKKGREYYYRLLCIHENYRGQGLGDILSSCVSFEKNNCLLWINDANIASIKLHEKRYDYDKLKNYIFLAKA